MCSSSLFASLSDTASSEQVLRVGETVTGLFAPKTIRSQPPPVLLGTFAPWNFRSALRVFVRDNICLWFFPSVTHSLFISGSKLTFSTNIFHHSLQAPTHLDCRLGLDWSYSAQRFSIFSYFFIYFILGREKSIIPGGNWTFRSQDHSGHYLAQKRATQSEKSIIRWDNIPPHRAHNVQ